MLKDKKNTKQRKKIVKAHKPVLLYEGFPR